MPKIGKTLKIQKWAKFSDKNGQNSDNSNYTDYVNQKLNIMCPVGLLGLIKPKIDQTVEKIEFF